MKHRVLSDKMALFILLGIFFFSASEESFGYPIGSNGWHLNSPFQARHNADLVCKVRILSIRQEEVIKYDPSTLMLNISRVIATSKVLSVIKGTCPQVIDIEFLYPKERNRNFGSPLCQIYTELSENEVCLVFLKGSKPYYQLNRIRSKARVQVDVVDYDLGETPNLRLLAEFLAGCSSDNEMIKLQAVEELGYLGEAVIRDISSGRDRFGQQVFKQMIGALAKVQETLRQVRNSEEDLVIKSCALISTFLAGDSQDMGRPLKLLQANPSRFDPNDSMKKYGVRDFCMSSLQLRLLQTMDSTTRRRIIDLTDGSVVRRKNGRPGIYRGVPGFDYAEFFKQALDCEAVKQNAGMRGAIANVIWIRCEKESVPEMVRLLDDESLYVRFVAVGSLMKYTDEGPERRGWEEFEETEQACVQYWKKWWQENKDRFMTHETVNNGAD